MATEKIQTPVLKDNSDLLSADANRVDALAELYDIYYPRILKYCIIRLFNKSTAEDMTSAIFLKAAQNFKNFSGSSNAQFQAWIYTIACNEINSYIRKNKRRTEIFDSIKLHLAKPEQSSKKQKIDWPRLYSAISKLKPKYQNIITLYFFQNMTIKQISKVLKIKHSTLRVQLHRAIDRLKENININHFQEK